MLEIPKGIRYIMAGLCCGLAMAAFAAGVGAMGYGQLFGMTAAWAASGAAMGLAFWFGGLGQ